MTYLTPDLYKTITDSIPVICVDLVPIRKFGKEWRIGIVTRATGPEASKPAILGGRVWHGETLGDAIARHLDTDWDIRKYKFSAINSESYPFHVQQYLHLATTSPPRCYDPTKHSIGLTYLIQITEEPKPRNEASDFYWIREGEIPESSAYNQHVVMELAFARIRQCL